jgi:hypothetical protein
MSTTMNDDCCVSLMQGTLVRPIARYPSSIAYDDPLKVAANRVRTSLVRNVGTGDTLFTVSDASRIVAQMLLTVDSEIVSVTSISGNILTVVRGFDGTQPQCHSAGSTLEANITAWHHNVLAAEITAIETALGPNLSNIGGSSSGPGPFPVNTSFLFTQSPGTTLSPGANVVTLSPVPRGVNGTDLSHYLYISGGTGTPEAVAIVGGTAVSGGASGTLIIQCANAHSGAWTLQSATAGIAEAYHSLSGNNGTVVIAPGIFRIYAPVVYTAVEDFNRVSFAGQGSLTTRLVVDKSFPLSVAGVFISNGPHISFAPEWRGFSIEGDQPWGTGGNRSNLIRFPPFFFTQGPCRGVLQDINISGAWDGVHVESLAGVSDAGGWSLFACYISAYNVGVNIINSYDTVRIVDCHFWPWVSVPDYEPADQYMALDPTCYAVKINRCDHFVMIGCLTYIGNALYIEGGTSASIDDCLFDAFSQCTVKSGYVRFTSCYFVLGDVIGGYNVFGPSINYTGGELDIVACNFGRTTSAYPSIFLGATIPGAFSMASVSLCHFQDQAALATAMPTIHVKYQALDAGATCLITGNKVFRDQDATYSPWAVIHIENGQYVRCIITNNTSTASRAGSKTFISCQTDNYHIIKNNNLMGYQLAYPASRVAGVYEDELYTFTKQHLVLGAERGIKFTETGAAPFCGTGQLAGGTKVVATTSATTVSRIFITPMGTAPAGTLYVQSINNGVSFTVASTNAADITVFSWMIYNNL